EGFEKEDRQGTPAVVHGGGARVSGEERATSDGGLPGGQTEAAAVPARRCSPWAFGSRRPERTSVAKWRKSAGFGRTAVGFRPGVRRRVRPARPAEGVA